MPSLPRRFAFYPQVSTKGFPSGRREPPSRARSNRQLIQSMQKTFTLSFDRAVGRLARTGGSVGGAKAIGATLLVALLMGFSTTQSATAAATYSVTIAWDSNPEPTVIGYRAHYGVASRDYSTVVDVGNTTSVVISGLVEGTPYFFSITAYDVLGLESDFSDELSYVPGTPTVRARVLPSGQAGLTLKGRIDHAYDLEATEDFATWTAIATVTLNANGSYEFTDPQAAFFTRRFYRLHDIQP